MPIEVGAVDCKACGARLRAESPAPTPIAGAPWEPTACPHCGRPLVPAVVVVAVPGAASGRPMDLDLVAPPAEGETQATGAASPLYRRRSLWRLRPEDFTPWQHCPFCRLLRYPVPWTSPD